MNKCDDHWQKLARDGDEVVCLDINDLNAKLAPFAAKLPGRTEGRRSLHREVYCAANYLIALGTESLLGFPVRLIKGEKPDFVLETACTSVGIEVTEAGTERSQRAYTQLESSPEGTVLVGEDHLQPIGLPLRMEGYAGKKPELIATDLIFKSVQKKENRIRRGDYRDASRHELLIWDCSHVNYMAISQVIQEMLRERILAWQSQGIHQLRYSKISVWRDTDSCLIYDVVSLASRLLYPPALP